MGVFNNFFSFLYTSKLRTTLRKLGFIELYKVFFKLKTKLYQIEYQLLRPEKKEIKIGSYVTLLYTSDVDEFKRVSSFKDDKHLICRLLQYVKNNNGNFWDVGANIGLYSLFIAKALGDRSKVVAFEPEKRVFNRLNENVKLNQLSNIVAFNYALGDENKMMQMKTAEHFSSGEHSLVAKKLNNSNNDMLSVQVFRGDDLISNERLDIPYGIKIDVEGFEEHVIDGLMQTLSKNACKFLLCEVHFSILESIGKCQTPKNLEIKLKNLGFSKQQWLDYSHLFVEKP